MNKKLIVTAASLAAAGLGVAGWLLFRKRRNASKGTAPHQQTHHLTHVFSQAKKHAKNGSLPTFKPA